MANLIWHLTTLKKALGLSLKESERIKLSVTAEEAQSVYFIFSKLNYRFYLPIIRAFHSNGYSCYIKFNHRFIGNGANFLSWIADLQKVYFTLTDTGVENCRLVIQDSKNSPLKSARKTLYLSDQIYDKDLKPLTQHVLPFSIHPDQYLVFNNLNKDALRSSERKYKVFFSGNASEEGYKDEIINRLHNKLSRNQILRTIKEDLGVEVINFLQPNSASDYHNKILLLTSDFWVNDTQKQHTIKKSEWFTYLATSDFFLACPGFSHPLCHNLIESMAVGTIPILEHPEYLQPNLQHGVNCIAFNGKSDLIEKLKQVLLLSPDQIAIMRQNVIAYYENYLAPPYLVKQLTSAANGTTFYYYSSAQSVNFFKKHFKPDTTPNA